MMSEMVIFIVNLSAKCLSTLTLLPGMSTLAVAYVDFKATTVHALAVL